MAQSLEDAPRPLKCSLWVAVPTTVVLGNVLTFVLGFIAGLALGPLLGIGMASLWSSFVLGVSSAHSVLYYGRIRLWVLKALSVIIVGLMNGGVLALTVYALAGTIEAAVFAAAVGFLIVLIFGLSIAPESSAFLDVYGLWERPRGTVRWPLESKIILFLYE